MAKQNEIEEKNEEKSLNSGHPDDFQVSGPRNLCTPNWRDLIRSSWKDENYKRTVMACFIQAAYLLELDRQEKRDGDAALAPKWWKPFKYKVVEELVDERDESIFGARLEWDRYAAFSDLLVVRPSKAPKAIIALRGTLLRAATIKRDIQDDLRILTMEDLSGSCRFHRTLEAVRTAVKKYGSSEVCMAGHSLGAGLALQVGKALTFEGIFVESHLFNPPSVSLPMGLRSIGDKFGLMWNAVKGVTRAIIPSKKKGNKELEGLDKQSEDVAEADSVNICQQIQKWVPHLYVNNSDYICCYYSDSCKKRKNCDGDEEKSMEVMPEVSGMDRVAAKLYVISKGPMKFSEAHGIQQWWSYESELQMAFNGSKLIQQQLGSLIQRSHLKTALGS